jgi:hypothetical protein
LKTVFSVTGGDIALGEVKRGKEVARARVFVEKTGDWGASGVEDLDFMPIFEGVP